MTKELRIFAGIQWGRFCAGRPSRVSQNLRRHRRRGEDSCKSYIQAGDYYIALASKGATPSPPRVGVEASEESMLSEGTISMELIRDPRSAGL